jgi:biotin operon repressor
LAIDQKKERIISENGIELKGTSYLLVSALIERFKSDQVMGLLPENYRFIGADELAQKMGIEQPTLRKYVSRARRELQKQLIETGGRQFEAEDVIENSPWKGYRLNPHLRLVQASELRSKEPRVSQLSEGSVTSSTAGR